MDDQGLQDAAIFLMSIGEEEAAEVFKHLSPKEVQKLGETIARTRAEVARQFLVDVFKQASPEENRGKPMTALSITPGSASISVSTSFG